MASRGETTDYADLRAALDAAVQTYLPTACSQDRLLAASRDAVSGPAKRVRSVLLVMAADAVGVARSESVRAGCAIEFTHAASLILDDLPAMDDADERRGRPATHVAYGEPTAVLAAIALLNESYRLLASQAGVNAASRTDSVALLARAVGFEGLVAGQLADLESHGAAGHDAITERHAAKTGVLFAASLAIGARLGTDEAARVQHAWDAGLALGVAFQGYDDLLDRYATVETVGKPVGHDVGKATIATSMARGDALKWCQSQMHEALAALGTAGLATKPMTDYVEGLHAALTEPLKAHSIGN